MREVKLDERFGGVVAWRTKRWPMPLQPPGFDNMIGCGKAMNKVNFTMSPGSEAALNGALTDGERMRSREAQRG